MQRQQTAGIGYFAIVYLLLLLNSADVTAADGPSRPFVSISDSTYFEGDLGATNLVFEVMLSSVTEQTVSVNFGAINDTAFANTDYTPTNGTLTFPPGVTNLNVNIAVNGDTVEEGHETFLVQLSDPMNAVLRDADGVGLIINDDGVAGKLDHFQWEDISSPQIVLSPFAAAFTARDALGGVVTNFNGTVELRAYSGLRRGSSVVISEVDPGPVDQVEFVNVSAAAVDLSRWQIALYDLGSWPSPKAVFVIPNGVMCSAAGIFTIREGGNSSGQFPNFNASVNLGWNDSAAPNPVAVALIDHEGEVVDFVAAGTADRARITSPNLIQMKHWNGPPLARSAGNTVTHQRTGDSNHSGPEDWVSGGRTIGRLNSGMAPMFTDGNILPVSPVSAATFVEGAWRGSLTILQYATNAVLRAADGNGHNGESKPFSLNLLNDLSVSLDVPLSAAVLEPFVLSISVSNSGPAAATQVILTNTVTPGARLVSVSSTGGTVETNFPIVARFEAIEAGGVARVDVTLIAEAFGILTNSISITRDGADPYLANNTAIRTIPVELECAGMSQNAIAWWSAEGDAVDRIQGNNGSVQNGTAFETGRVGQGFSFDGVDDMILVPDHPSLAIDAGEDFSIEAWIKVPSGTLPEVLVIFDKRVSPDASSAMGILFWVSNGRLAAQMADAPLAPGQFSNFVSPGPDVRDGMFHHVAVSVARNSETGGKLYVDGSVVLTFNPTVEPGDLSNDAPVRIGRGANPVVPAPFKGVIDEIVFSRKALTSAEIMQVFQAGSRGRCEEDINISTTALSPGEVYAGQTVSFRLNVFNFGRTPSSGVRLTNELPTNVRFVSATPSQGSTMQIGNQIIADFGDIEAGTNASLTITVHTEQTGPATNTASVFRVEEERNILNNISLISFSILPDCISLPAGSSLWAGEGDALDQGGRNHGTLQGVAFTMGKVGRSFTFDGVDDTVIVPNSASLNFGSGVDFSLEAWIRWELGSPREIVSIIDKRSVPTGETPAFNASVGYALFVYGGNLGFQLGTAPLRADNFQNYISSGPNLLDGVFHHVVVSIDRDSDRGGTLYVDGEPVLIFDPTAQGGDLVNDQPLRIGQGAQLAVNSNFRGSIDEPAVHARVLSQQEIRAMFLNGMRGYCPLGNIDRDNDALPDAWESANGLNRFDPDDALGDLDADGFSNLNEYKAGTDPGAATSTLRVALPQANGNDVRILISTVPGRNYRIEQTPSLAPADWFPVGEVLTGTGEVQQVLLPVDSSTRRQFYRARLVEP